MSDPHPILAVAYAQMELANPVSLDSVEHLLAGAPVRPGGRVLDLGCGSAPVAVFLAQRFGLGVEALERAPAVAALARERVARAGVGDRVRVLEAEAQAHLAEAAPYDLLVCLGASNLVAGRPEAARIFPALAAHLSPGGLLLYGEAFLKRPPEGVAAAMLAPFSYSTAAETAEAAAEAGLTLWGLRASTEREWDDYSFAINGAALRWLEGNAGHPDAAAVRQRAEVLRTAYLTFGRDTLGFGLWLFRKGV